MSDNIINKLKKEYKNECLKHNLFTDDQVREACLKDMKKFGYLYNMRMTLISYLLA